MSYSQVCIIVFVISSFLFGNGTLPSQVSKVILVSGALVSVYQYGIHKLSKIFLWWTLFFAFICILSVSWAVSPLYTTKYLPTVLYALLCGASLFIILQRDKPTLQLLNQVFVVSSLLLFIRFVFIHGFNFNTVNRSSAELGMSMNTIGLICSFGCVMSYHIYKNNGKDIKWIIVTFVLLLMAIISGSRKAIIFPAIAFAVQQVVSSQSKKIILALLYILFALGLTWVLLMDVPYFYEMAGHRFELMLNGVGNVEGVENSDASTLTRARLIELGMSLFYKNPILGYGIEAFRFFHGYLYTHNNYVELLVSLGIVGTIIYYIIYVIVIVKLYLIAHQKKDPLAITYLSIMIGLVILHYGFVGYYDLLNIILLSMCASYALSFNSRRKRMLRISNGKNLSSVNYKVNRMS